MSRAVLYAAVIALLSVAAIIVVATHLPLVSVVEEAWTRKTGEASDRPAQGSDPLIGRRETTPSRTSAPEGSSLGGPGIRGVDVYTNDAGGYLFSYPETWTVAERGKEALLTSPDDRVRVSFGSEKEGSLSQVSASLVGRITRTHGGVEILTSTRDSTDQGLRALIVGGTAMENGVEGRFLAISLGGSGEKKMITVFFPRGLDALESLDAIPAILSSYRVEAPVIDSIGFASVIPPAG